MSALTEGVLNWGVLYYVFSTPQVTHTHTYARTHTHTVATPTGEKVTFLFEFLNPG